MILGIDVGSKRIGLALMHPEALLPYALPTISAGDQAMEQIIALITREKVETVVVGFPRRLNGETSEQSAYCQEFANNLRARLTSVEVLMQDETLTSVAAIDQLQQARKVPASGEVDALAACMILSDYANKVQRRGSMSGVSV